MRQRRSTKIQSKIFPPPPLFPTFYLFFVYNSFSSVSFSFLVYILLLLCLQLGLLPFFSLNVLLHLLVYSIIPSPAQPSPPSLLPFLVCSYREKASDEERGDVRKMQTKKERRLRKMLGDGGEKVIAKKEKRGEGAPLLCLPFSLPFPSSSITFFSHTGLTV